MIENAGPDSVFATLKSLLSSVVAIDVHVAFTTSSGLDLLLSRLRKVAAKGRLRFLTGLYQGCTEPNALKTLLQAQQFYGEQFQVRLSTETNFHRKAFLVRAKQTLHLVIGSSNFSANGLLSAGELNVLVSLPAGTAKAKATERAFDRAWVDGVELTKERIDRYNERRDPPDARSISKAGLKSIIGPRAKHTTASAPPTRSRGGVSTSRKVKHWVDGIGGFVAKQTELVIADETNWDRNGWPWRTCRPGGYERGDEVLLLDKSTKPAWASITRVVDVAPRTATPTPDGRCFVAYRQVPRTPRRKLTAKVARELRTAGVVRTDGVRALVSEGAWTRVLELFGRSQR